MKDQKKSFLRWLFPSLALIAIIALIALSSKPRQEPSIHKETSDSKETEAPPSTLYIEDTPHLHSGIQDLNPSTCQACHPVEFLDWKESTHALATSSQAYRKTYISVASRLKEEGIKHCSACHVPQAVIENRLSHDGVIKPDSPEAMGISCSACHSKDTNVGLKLLEPTLPEIPPKPLSPREPQLCYFCHNQELPLVSILNSDLKFDESAGNPYAEWLESQFSKEGESYKSCLDCHGSAGNGTLHRWPRNKVELIKSAYTIKVLEPQKHEDGWRIGYSFVNSGAGHSLPTGDPGYMLIIDARVQTSDGTILGESAVTISHFKKKNHSKDTALPIIYPDDNRLSPGSKVESWIRVKDPDGKLDGRDDLVIDYVIIYGPDFATEYAFKALRIDEKSIIIEEGKLQVPMLKK